MSAYWPADESTPLLELSLGALLREVAGRVPERTALVAGTPDPAQRRRWTYAELLAEAEQAARALLARFSPGERVAAYANNVPEWVILELAAALAGMTVVTVAPSLRERELHHVLSRAHVAGVFLVREYRRTQLAQLVEGLALPELRHTIDFAEWDAFLATGQEIEPPDVDPRDPALILFTSGTTGTPKGAVLHHRGVVNNAQLSYARMGLTKGFVQVSPMPLYHAAGCAMAVVGTIAHEGTLVLPPHFDPALTLELTATERAECVGGVPTMLLAMLEHPAFFDIDLGSVEAVLTGGAIVPPSLGQRGGQGFNAPMSIVFAQTEASPVITQTSPADRASDRVNTLGTPLPHTAVKIVDSATGEIAQHDAIGEICTRGYHVMTGYLDDPLATAQTIDEDGWLHTGDLGSMDERGYCRIGGRLKDMIIRGGVNIYPRKIELVLFEHPSVADVAVVGVPDEQWGEQVAAFIRLADGATADEDKLFAFCREQLAPHKTPRYWTFLDAFPLTASGKVQKFALRERFIEQASQS